MTEDPKTTLVHWLRDAYAMEGQAVTLLEAQIDRLEHYPAAQVKMREHLEETHRQQKLLEDCFARLGTEPSSIKEGVMKFAAGMQGMLHGLAEDEVMKHALASHAFERFEAASYKALVVAAERAGELEVARTCESILQQEEAMAAWLWDELPKVTREYLDRAASGGAAKR